MSMTIVSSEKDRKLLASIFSDLSRTIFEEPPPDLISRLFALDNGRFGIIFITKPFMTPQIMAKTRKKTRWDTETLLSLLNYLAFILFSKFPMEITKEILEKWGKKSMESLTSEIQRYLRDPRFKPSQKEKELLKSFYQLLKDLKGRKNAKKSKEVRK